MISNFIFFKKEKRQEGKSTCFKLRKVKVQKFNRRTKSWEGKESEFKKIAEVPVTQTID